MATWDQAVKELNNKLERTIAETVQEIADTIISRTPVLSGALAANWNTTLNSPDFEFDKSKVSSMGAKSQTYQVVQEYKITDTVYIVNGAPYSELIEYGNYSNKAPQGMVRVSLLNFQNILDKKGRENEL